MKPLVKFLGIFVIMLKISDDVDANSLAKKSNSTLEYNYYNIYSKIDALEKDLKNMETRVQGKKRLQLLQKILKSITELDDNPGSPDKTLKNNKHLQTQKKNAIGFTTKLTGTYSSSSSIIRGHKILYNGGNAYNGTVFTCPSPGLYLFQVSLLTSSPRRGIWIYKNSQQLTLAFSGSNPQYNGHSVSAVVWLDVGDQVFLRTHVSDLSLDPDSAFTGVKVN